MAGPTTAERGARKPKGPSSARPSRPGRPRGGRRRVPGPRALLLILSVLVFVIGGTWVLYGSDWLRVERVSVSGLRVLTPDEVKRTAAVPLGDPLVSVDVGEIEDRLRRKLPRIDSVEVVRSWPHGIGLKVTERKPVLLIEKGGKFIEVDVKGVRFATVDTPPKGVPRLDLTVSRSPSLRRFDADRLTLEAVGVAGDLPAAVARDAGVVRVRSYDSVTLELSGGRTVVWGSGEDGEAKARALTALMKAAPKAGHFDVSAPTALAASGS
ncbi:cell division protein FtsQ/DivIB [Streptomyces sp. SP18CS02]|uniref:cell division protein FtsQ/DivIB n=1 Tax=Streptomyces sp. SP18CS02 TaxID=3002531 RepID=UPI002E79E12B|nr:FtsQ-type POTRA domain-containing protein [Streptomyces sp. SP18CS02]MEE1755064.1 FtsQ-type POTRA domain-containing protein [Streptomyces sp. SP18CS02]